LIDEPRQFNNNPTSRDHDLDNKPGPVVAGEQPRAAAADFPSIPRPSSLKAETKNSSQYWIIPTPTEPNVFTRFTVHFR